MVEEGTTHRNDSRRSRDRVLAVVHRHVGEAISTLKTIHRANGYGWMAVILFAFAMSATVMCTDAGDSDVWGWTAAATIYFAAGSWCLYKGKGLKDQAQWEQDREQ